MPDEGRAAGRTRLVKVDQHHEVATAFSAGSVVAVPAVGGYALAVKAGMLAAEAHLNALVTDPDGPHYLAANSDAVRTLTSGWNDQVQALLERCWPGPLELFLPRAAPAQEADGEKVDADGADTSSSGEQTGGWARVVGTPDGRALRRLCKEEGPWRTVPLTYHTAEDVVRAFDASDVALVVDGGERVGERPTVVDATASPPRVLHEGALPSTYVEGAILMSSRRRGLFRRRRGERPTS